MPAYATRADMEAYVEGWVTDSATALDRLLERASRDVDEVLGPMPVLTTGTYTGFKLDPRNLAAWEAAALARATCAQAEHRFTITEATLRGTGERTWRVRGPDFDVYYDPPSLAGSGRFSRKLPAELAPIGHLRRLRGRAVA